MGKTKARKAEEPPILSLGVSLSDVRPTQMTVGEREVGHKRKLWCAATAAERTDLLRRHIAPAVVGPKGKFFIIDHHHFAKALLDEDEPEIGVNVIADLQHLPRAEFWTFLDNSAWCHAYDGKGERCDLASIPKSLSALADDPYRSLAGSLYRHGGYAKSSASFYEFIWADFLRRRIRAKLVETDFDQALAGALELAKSAEARGLPGWVGERSD